MFNPVTISLKVGQQPQFINGVSSIKRPMEVGTANRFLKDASSSRFSVAAYGQLLYEAAESEEEKDKALLAALYYINRVAGEEDTSRGYLAQRVMDVLDHYGYVNVGVEVATLDLDV